MPPPTPGKSCPSVSVTSISNGATAWFWRDDVFQQSVLYIQPRKKQTHIIPFKKRIHFPKRKDHLSSHYLCRGSHIASVLVLHHKKKKTENMFQRLLGNLENHGKLGLFPKQTQFQTCRGSSVVGLHCMAPLRFLGDLQYMSKSTGQPHMFILNLSKVRLKFRSQDSDTNLRKKSYAVGTTPYFFKQTSQRIKTDKQPGRQTDRQANKQTKVRNR